MTRSFSGSFERELLWEINVPEFTFGEFPRAHRPDIVFAYSPRDLEHLGLAGRGVRLQFASQFDGDHIAAFDDFVQNDPAARGTDVSGEGALAEKFAIAIGSRNLHRESQVHTLSPAAFLCRLLGEDFPI
ncbi:MAG: hypothetical protein WA871_09335 [Candidatus Acidiferrales bacterium]